MLGASAQPVILLLHIGKHSTRIGPLTGVIRSPARFGFTRAAFAAAARRSGLGAGGVFGAAKGVIYVGEVPGDHDGITDRFTRGERSFHQNGTAIAAFAVITVMTF